MRISSHVYHDLHKSHRIVLGHAEESLDIMFVGWMQTYFFLLDFHPLPMSDGIVVFVLETKSGIISVSVSFERLEFLLLVRLLLGLGMLRLVLVFLVLLGDGWLRSLLPSLGGLGLLRILRLFSHVAIDEMGQGALSNCCGRMRSFQSDERPWTERAFCERDHQKAWRNSAMNYRFLIGSIKDTLIL
jgi:hypothetical protein